MSEAPARVLMVSLRQLRRTLERASNFELEDLVQQFDRVDFVAPAISDLPPLWRARLRGRLQRKVPSLKPAGHRSAPPSARYELGLFVCQEPADLYLLGSFGAYRRQCRQTLCWIEESWANEMDSRLGELQMLADFDHVVTCFEKSVEPLSRILGRPVRYLPTGIDTLLFCPYPRLPERRIDVFNMGRRSPRTHAVLRRAADEKRLFYFFSTQTLGQLVSEREHREHLADLIQRSRYFLVYQAKVDAGAQTGGQSELGFRYFEGAAAGTIMLGMPPESDTFNQYFGWQDSIITMPFHSTQVIHLTEELDADPERRDAIRRENVLQSLRRHDWSERWEQVLHLVGLEEEPALVERRSALAERQEQVASLPVGGLEPGPANARPRPS